MLKYLLLGAIALPSCEQLQQTVGLKPQSDLSVIAISDAHVRAKRDKPDLPPEVKTTPRVSSDPPLLFRSEPDKPLESVPVIPNRGGDERDEPLTPEFEPLPTPADPPKEKESSGSPQKAGKPSAELKQINKRWFVVYSPNFFCPNCVKLDSVIEDMRKTGWHDNLIVRVKNHRGFSSYPHIELVEDGQTVYTVKGLISADRFNQLWRNRTPNEIKKWIAKWNGPRVGVEPRVAGAYISHICDKGSHNGLAYEPWQLQGLTFDELEKVHSAQHEGKKYAVPQ